MVGCLSDFAPGEGEARGAFRAEFDDSEWLEVELPCDVHTALIAAGRIPHPYVDANESAVAWVAAREWWYRCRLDAPEPGGRISLVLHGVDTDVAIWLNGVFVGEHQSTFRPAEFDVTSLVEGGGSNVVCLRFASVVDAETDVSDVAVRDSVRQRRRKMQVAFGWDISCVLLTAGVWQPIELRPAPTLGPLSFSTVHLDERRAIVRIGADVDADYELVEPDGTPAGSGTLENGEAFLVVERPAVWWTHDLGTPHLYDLTVTHKGEARHTRVGIRTVTLDQSHDPDEPPNRFFRMVLNGRPLFARGANWVPEDLRLGAVPDETYRERLAQAAAANMNTIRVWGGGCYEQDAFYAACDELGLLIWHDFMFACLPYPDDAAFLAECEAEARHQVARLHTHPSVALWCGNNEADPVAGRALFGGVLRRVVEAAGIPYWPGSPYGSRTDGDTHDWRGFHGTDEQGQVDRSGAGRHWRRYATDVGRFVSEFGFASAATRSTIEHWNSEGERHPLAHAWQNRIRYVPGDSHVALFEATTGQPETAQEWIDFSQLVQAEGLRFGIERFRERKPHCSGALLWQLNDCWPGFTWSVVDFDGHPKPAYYAVRRSFAPVLASVAPLEGGGFELWVVNDSPEDAEDVLLLRIERFDGTVLDEQRFPVRAEATAAAQLVRRFGWGRLLQPRSTYVTVASERGYFAPNHQLFADFRELELSPVELTVQTESIDARTVDVTVGADAFTPSAAIDHPQPGLHYDDNYFSVSRGRPRTIRVHHPRKSVDPELFEARIVFDPAERAHVRS